MKKIYLTKGKFTLVDDEDYESLNKYKWCTKPHRHTFYAVRTEHNKSIRMHRVIMRTPVGLLTDHINGNGLDNRKINLRICTAMENARNRKFRIDNKTGHTGIEKHGNRWRAKIYVNKKRIRLPSFSTKEGAALSYKFAARLYFGKFYPERTAPSLG